MKKIFISHTFTEKDRELALKLGEILKKHDMDGYLAEKQPEYKLLISDKIKGEISGSSCLAAIITTNSPTSASVHEEVGFAMGKDIEVLLMIEKSKEMEGVLAYGKEPEYFTVDDFAASAERIAHYIDEKIPEKTNRAKIPMKDYIISRNLHDRLNVNFCKNDQTDILKSEMSYVTAHEKVPFILFSAWPHNQMDIPVQAQKIAGFLKSHKSIEIENRHVHFLDNYDERGIDSLVFYNNPPNPDQGTYGAGRDITRYLELQTNGFLEQGISKKIIKQINIGGMYEPALHHCWLTGAYWAFLKFTRMYYGFNGIGEKIDVALSIRNVGDLMLHGFGGKINNTTSWSEPGKPEWDTEKPLTKLRNIQIKLENINLQQMTDEFIKSEVRKISDRIAHAYNLESAMCYNDDGSFNWEMMSWYNRNL